MLVHYFNNTQTTRTQSPRFGETYGPKSTQFTDVEKARLAALPEAEGLVDTFVHRDIDPAHPEIEQPKQYFAVTGDDDVKKSKLALILDGVGVGLLPNPGTREDPRLTSYEIRKELARNPKPLPW